MFNHHCTTAHLRMISDYKRKWFVTKHDNEILKNYQGIKKKYKTAYHRSLRYHIRTVRIANNEASPIVPEQKDYVWGLWTRGFNELQNIVPIGLALAISNIVTS